MGHGIAFPSISRDQLQSLPIPLPPHPEQERISAKVDELMALCDELEETLTSAQTERGRLLEVLLHDASR
jgi:type I restriction enzyme S subunit